MGSTSTAAGQPAADARSDSAAITDEAELVAASQAGSNRAFAELVRRHKREVLAFVSRFCELHSDIDDLGQEVFCKAYENLGAFKSRSSFRTWLYRIASNTCLDHLRQRRRNPVQNTPLPEDERSAAVLGSRESTESRLDCRRLLAHLSPKDRLVVTLLYVEGFSVKETAAISGLSAANVRVRAFRAKARLRQFMEEQHGGT